MSEQALLPGFEPVARPTDRLLFLIYPDTAARWPISRLAIRYRDELKLHGRPLETDIFHVTLFHLGDFPGLPRDIVARAVQAAATVQMAPFEVSFDRVMSFSGKIDKRPLVLHSGEGAVSLMEFQRIILEALVRVKLVRSGASKFKPHVTLLYDRREDPHQIRNQFSENRKARRKMMELTRTWMKRFDDPFVSHKELMASGIPWKYPDQGGAVNRTSPLEWVKQTKLQPAKFRSE